MAKPSRKARARRREIRRRQEIKHRWQSRLVTAGIVALVILVGGGLVYAAARPILGQAIPSIPLVVRSPDDVLRISPAKAKELVDGGGAVLYDTRSADQYRALHAAGAVSFPEHEATARFNELPDDLELIFYCTWPAEQTSARVAFTVIDQGKDPSKVYALVGGLDAWQAAGYPMESGE